MAFEAPSTSTEGPKVSELNGHLLIISPISYERGIPTVHGEAEAIKVNLVDLDTNEEHNGVLWFNVALRNALDSKIGKTILARIGQGVAKPGKSAPWILLDATTDAAAVAKANAYIANGLAAPATATAPAAAPAPATATASIDDPAVQALLAQLGAQQVK